jgi:hypothetical protein
MDSQDPWKENRWANTTTWTFSSTPGVQRRWCWYHVFVVTKMGDMGHVLVTSPSPSAQAQMTWLHGDHNDWRLTTAAETQDRHLCVCRSICGKTRPCTPQRSRLVFVRIRRGLRDCVCQLCTLDEVCVIVYVKFSSVGAGTVWG